MQIWVVPVGISGILLLAGVLMVWKGVRILWTGLRVGRGDWQNASGVGDGFAKLAGTATVRDGTVTAPFSGRECLAYRAAIKTYTPSASGTGPGEPDHPDWDVNQTVEASEPFGLQDSTGTVTVDVEGTNWSLPTDHSHTVDSGDTPDGQYAAFVDDHDIYLFDDEDVADAQKVRFVETRIDPDDDLAVAGPVVEDGADRRIQAADRLLAPTPFVLAESKAGVNGSGDGGILLTALGLVFIVAPLAVVLSVL